MLCVTIITYLNECTMLSYTNNKVQEYEKTKTIQNAFSIRRAIHYDYNIAARPHPPPTDVLWLPRNFSGGAAHRLTC